MTIISVVGVAFGVMALTVVIGVTGGFQDAFRDRILGLYPHLVVAKRAETFRQYRDVLDTVRGVEGVEAAAPATYDDMMIASGVHRSGTVVKGVVPDAVDRVLGLRDLLVEGELSALDETPDVRVDGGEARVRGLVAGTRWTVVARPDRPPVRVRADRTPPEAGHARVSVLDLRGDGEPLPLALTRLDGGAPEEAPDGTGEPVPSRSRALGPTKPSARTEARTLKAGAWRLDRTGERLELPADRRVTLALLPSEGEGLRTRRLVAPKPAELPERRAAVRLLNLTDDSLRLVAEGSGPAGAAADGESGEPEGADRASEGPPVPSGMASGFRPLPAKLPAVILGAQLAEKLDAEPGTPVTLVTPLRGIDNKMLGPTGMAPSSARLRVAGTFESGFHEYDVRLALANLRAAQRILNRGDVIRWIEVRTADLMRSEAVKRRLRAHLDPYDMKTLVGRVGGMRDKMERYLAGNVRSASPEDPSRFLGGIRNLTGLLGLIKYRTGDAGHQPSYRLVDWREMNANLFGALKLQQVVLTIFFLIIVLVGSFVVVGSQIMVVHEKRSDVAILRAMGATRGVIRLVFTLQGVLVAWIGTLVGLAVGLGLCGLVRVVDYRLDASVYLIDRLPVRIDVPGLVLVAVATTLTTLVATQYSAGRAASRSPVEGLREVE